jgi:uncharacterized protein (DUF1919 family)
VVTSDAELKTNNMYGKPFKMMGKSPMMKKLVGKQNNLPEELKAKIEASPAKKYKSDAQRKAIHASKAEKAAPMKNYKKGYYGA